MAARRTKKKKVTVEVDIEVLERLRDAAEALSALANAVITRGPGPGPKPPPKRAKKRSTAKRAKSRR